MKSTILIALVLSLLAGCESKKPEAPKEVIQTVEWYVKHEPERNTTLEKCRKNPSELDSTSNCLNAVAAGRIKSVESTKKYDF